MTKASMRKILAGGGNVTKMPIIDHTDKFILKKSKKDKNENRGYQKNLERGGGPQPPPKFATCIIINILRTRAKSSYGTCDEVGRAKSSYGMSSSKILRVFKSN